MQNCYGECISKFKLTTNLVSKLGLNPPTKKNKKEVSYPTQKTYEGRVEVNQGILIQLGLWEE